jgi:nucleotide-binding universal stress UspA family protein
MEVFHGVPGTSYSFRQRSKGNREQELIDGAKQRLEARFLPLLRPHRIPYQLHLFAERTECPDERVRELIVQDIEQRDAAIVILAAHNKAEDQPGLGSVADYVSRNCRRPTAFVRPHAQAQ